MGKSPGLCSSGTVAVAESSSCNLEVVRSEVKQQERERGSKLVQRSSSVLVVALSVAMLCPRFHSLTDPLTPSPFYLLVCLVVVAKTGTTIITVGHYHTRP